MNDMKAFKAMEANIKRLKANFDNAISSDKMEAREAYIVASDMLAHLEATVDGLRCDLSSQGIDPDDLDM